MTSLAGNTSWADFVDEAVADVNAGSQEQLKSELCSSFGFDSKAAAAFVPVGSKLLECVSGQAAGAALQQSSWEEQSVGSVQHMAGRCKPCAFFHTKGCQNDKACLFCHLCPPGEKQRRKRLRERMCEKLGQCMQQPFDPVHHNFGHMRQASGTSTGTSSTQSTSSGWTKFSHSRQSSGSSVAHAQDVGVVGMQMGCNPHMHQMMPVFHFAQATAQQMGPYGAEGNAPEQLEEQAALEEADAGSSQSSTISLAQAVPMPEQFKHSGWAPSNMMAPQMAPHMAPQMSAPQWNEQHGCMVQYALVPVAVPMQQQNSTDTPMPYGCFAQQPQQMPLTPGSSMQWGVQVGPQFANQNFCSRNEAEAAHA